MSTPLLTTPWAPRTPRFQPLFSASSLPYLCPIAHQWCALASPACGTFKSYMHQAVLPAITAVVKAYNAGQGRVEALAGRWCVCVGGGGSGVVWCGVQGGAPGVGWRCWQVFGAGAGRCGVPRGVDGGGGGHAGSQKGVVEQAKDLRRDVPRHVPPCKGPLAFVNRTIATHA